jgi:hypothetical protein
MIKLTSNSTFEAGNSSSLAPYSNKIEPILQSLRFLSICTSLVCIRVLTNPKLKDSTYRYLALISLCDLLYSFSILFLSFSARICERTGSEPSSNFFFLLLYILVSEYLTSCLAFFNLLVEILLTISRRYIISNRSFMECYQITINQLVFIFGTFSFVAYLPVLFCYKIETVSTYKSDSSTKYRVVNTYFGETRLSTIYLILVTSLRVFLASVVLLLLNLSTILAYNAYLRKKSSLKEIKRKYCQFKFTFMV